MAKIFDKKSYEELGFSDLLINCGISKEDFPLYAKIGWSKYAMPVFKNANEPWVMECPRYCHTVSPLICQVLRSKR